MPGAGTPAATVRQPGSVTFPLVFCRSGIKQPDPVGSAQSLRRWLRERLGVERTEAQRMTAKEFIAQAQREAPRQSRGIRM